MDGVLMKFCEPFNKGEINYDLCVSIAYTFTVNIAVQFLLPSH